MSSALALLAAREASVLVTAKSDRLARRLHDLYGLMDLGYRQGWEIRTADRLVDTTTEQGRLLAALSGFVAEFEGRLISSRTADALAAKKAQGARLGGPISTPPATRERIRVLRLDGLTMEAIAATLNAEGLPTASGKAWTWHNVRRVTTSLALDDQAAAR
jgi:DNA invertase Pin-like site-specific DNA recombinase